MCSHIVEKRDVLSSHFKRKHSIAGRNIHLPASQKLKLRWFVYLEECVHSDKIYQYVGSTNSMTQRWSNTKSVINSLHSNPNILPGTGLEKYFKTGCSEYKGPSLDHVKISLLEHFDTSEEKLWDSIHQAGPGCRCSECNGLKRMEDKWILRMGTYHGETGLNDRDEITRNIRVSLTDPV